MKPNDIFADARVMQVRELKAALAETKARLAKAESERDLLAAHFPLGMAALHDFESLAAESELRIIDGWNAILRMKNVSKLSSENISDLKKSYLTGLGISEPAPEGADLPPVSSWIVFDGKDANSYRAGAYRVTYTGGTGAHRADRMRIDYVNVAKVLGLDVSRIVVETADKDLSKRLTALGAKVVQSADGVEK
ncbi:MAG: hypothetical protein IKJ45_03835 [Kiritimatiellae bacterium]|nr:hypothetical protein [Kiritimatiellia bacterium]